MLLFCHLFYFWTGPHVIREIPTRIVPNAGLIDVGSDCGSLNQVRGKARESRDRERFGYDGVINDGKQGTFGDSPLIYPIQNKKIQSLHKSWRPLCSVFRGKK